MRMLHKLIIIAVVLAVAACAAVGASTQSKSALGNQDVEKSETAVCDLIADAVRAELNTDIAFIAASEVNAKDTPFEAGEISSSDINALVSYPDDPLAEVSITGKALRQALEKSVSIYPQPNLGFLQVSGLEFTFDPSKDIGERVTSVKVAGAQIIDSRTYTVGMTNSMANGALGYWKIWSSGDVKHRHSDKSIIKAVEDYMTANKTIDYGTLDRIKVVK
ncbi:5'-nucleotidase C-terminal domain-containing protein [bacterium]|nr:5'-nucleotidase C-terminal domain-containing protein [bacterium]